MRFKINYSSPTELNQFLIHNENTHNTEANYVSRGDNQSINELLRSLQSMILGDDDQDQNILLMMQMDEEGSISIGLMKRNIQHEADRYKPDFQSTMSAIMQYEDSQQNLSYSLRQSMQQVKRNRQIYHNNKELVDKWSAFAQANKTIMNLIEIAKEQPICIKNRTFSEQTVQTSVVEQKTSQKQSKAEPSNIDFANDEDLYLQFQEFQACFCD